MGDRGKLLVKLALDKNVGGDIWKKVKLGIECTESMASCSGNSGNDNNLFERNKFDTKEHNHECFLQVSSLENIKPSLLNHELNEPIPGCSDNTGKYDKSYTDPLSFNKLSHNCNEDCSSSDSSSTASEYFTTDESNYSPSESDAESSTSSESQVSLSSFVDNRLLQDKEGAVEVNKDKKSRKRKADKSTWKKNLAKKLKDQGKAYISSTTNKPMKERSMGPPCKNTCRLKCYLNIPNETRQQIFQEYWDLGDANKQRDFISSCIVGIKPKYQYHVHENKRRDNNGFYFTIIETRIRVCKTFFKSTLNITDRPIRTVVEKRSEIGIVENDRRGKHNHHRKLHENIREEMKRHINSIPRIESHYTRSRSSREYIEGGKSLADLYNDYVEKCKQKNFPYGKYLIYHQVFHKHFNISFFTPKKDQCSLCVSYGNAADAQKEELRSEYENHIMEKDLSRLEKNNDKIKINNNYVVAVYKLFCNAPREMYLFSTTSLN